MTMTSDAALFLIVVLAVVGTLLTIGFFHCETTVEVRDCRSFFIVGLAGAGFGLLVLFVEYDRNIWIPVLALVVAIQLFAGGSIQVWRINKRARESQKSRAPRDRERSTRPAEPAGSAARRPAPSSRPYNARFQSHKKYLQQKR